MTDNASMTSKQRFLALLEQVLERSRNGGVVWAEFAPHRFGAQIGGHRLIVESEDADFRHPYRVEVDPSEFEDALLSLSTSDDELSDKWVTVVGELFSEAHKRGSSAERALDEMFSSLKAPPPSDDDIPF